MRRAASLLFATVLAAVLIPAAATTAAQAAGTGSGPAGVSPAVIPVPAPGTWSEIFPPLISPSTPKCLDEPGGSSSWGLQLQIYHCHGYASNGGPQRWLWQLDAGTGGGNVYRLKNANTGLCIGVHPGPPVSGTAVEQDDCGTINFFDWVLTPSSNSPHFQLRMWDYPNLCMAVSDTSGNNDTPLVLRPCQTPTVYYEPQDMTWQIG